MHSISVQKKNRKNRNTSCYEISKKDNKIAIRTVGKNDPENIIRVFFRALIKLKIPIKSQAEIGNMRTQLLSRDFWKSL